MPKAKRWEPSKNYRGNPHNLMPPIKQEFDNLQPNEVIPYFKPDEVIVDDMQEAYQSAMCIMMLIFDDINESYMLDRVHRQFGAKQGTARNPLVFGKRSSRQEVYEAWYNLGSHPIIHNVTNPPKDIFQPHNQEEEAVVLAHEPQYIMRPQGYEDQLVSAVQASTIILAEALTLRQKWYLGVYNRVNNAFETLSKFVPVDMIDIESKIENLQR
ncbi:hypothetical protein AMTR_s00013p00206580 [Amborella trichopoda]|uniref:Uncharacterized protein n=1 Tax=Amborella trichopoda TaxID=13333 RepID=W1PQH4_AMBTC|nr:hypothetical protein AMTR_s00013p00206580 [Amborella trichopoda]